MEQSPSWEANRSSASQEIPGVLWNPKVYYRIDKHSSHIPFLTHISPVHAFTFHWLKIHFNIILPYTSRSFGGHLQDPVVYGSILLKWILSDMGKRGLNWSGSG